MDEGRVVLARSYFADHVNVHPEDSAGLEAAGTSWMAGAQRSPSRAIEYWLRYLEVRGSDDEINLRIARSYLVLGEWEKALHFAHQAGRSFESRLLLAQIQLELDPAAAEQTLSALLAESEDQPTALSLGAQVADILGRTEQALARAERALELDPLDQKATYLLARLKMRQGQTEASERSLSLHQSLARLEGQGSLPQLPAEERLTLLEEISDEIDKPSETLTFRLLETAVEAGQLARAREIIEASSMEVDDFSAARKITLGGLAARSGNLDLAQELFLSVWRSTKEAPARGHDRLRREALDGLVLLLLRDEPSKARSLLVEGLEEFPASARFLYALGRIERDAGEPRAGETLERALHLAPWNEDCRVDLADLRITSGEVEEAARLLSEAPEQTPRLLAYRSRRGLK